MFIGNKSSQAGSQSNMPAFKRVFDRHRRLCAALIAGLAAFLTLTALSPKPTATVDVVVASHQIESGQRLAESDVKTVAWPAEFAQPAGGAVNDVVGKLSIGPIDESEPITRSRLVDSNVLDSLPNSSGLVAAPIHLSDAEQTSLIRPGDRVDVIAAHSSDRDTQTAVVIAPDAIVLTIPAREKASAGGGLLDSGGAGSIDSKSLIIVAVPGQTATDLAAAGTHDQLSIVLKPNPG